MFFFFSSRRRHTRLTCDWSSDVCSSDLSVHSPPPGAIPPDGPVAPPETDISPPDLPDQDLDEDMAEEDLSGLGAREIGRGPCRGKGGDAGGGGAVGKKRREWQRAGDERE